MIIQITTAKVLERCVAATTVGTQRHQPYLCINAVVFPNIMLFILFRKELCCLCILFSLIAEKGFYIM